MQKRETQAPGGCGCCSAPAALPAAPLPPRSLCGASALPQCFGFPLRPRPGLGGGMAEQRLHRATSLWFSTSGTESATAKKKRFKYELVIPAKGVYRAPGRPGRKKTEAPMWMWPDSVALCWFAGPESTPMAAETFDQANVRLYYMSGSPSATRPGWHRWVQRRNWNDLDAPPAWDMDSPLHVQVGGATFAEWDKPPSNALDRFNGWYHSDDERSCQTPKDSDAEDGGSSGVGVGSEAVAAAGIWREVATPPAQQPVSAPAPDELPTAALLHRRPPRPAASRATQRTPAPAVPPEVFDAFGNRIPPGRPHPLAPDAPPGLAAAVAAQAPPGLPQPVTPPEAFAVAAAAAGVSFYALAPVALATPSAPTSSRASRWLDPPTQQAAAVPTQKRARSEGRKPTST